MEEIRKGVSYYWTLEESLQQGARLLGVHHSVQRDSDKGGLFRKVNAPRSQ